jgi:ATP-binding cassette, subfamily B, bacterial MsbA
MQDVKFKSSKVSSRELWFRLLTYVRPYWRMFAVSIGAMVVVAACDPVLPAMLGLLLDGSFGHKNPALMRWLPQAIAPDAIIPTLISWMPVVIILIFLIRGVASFVSGYAVTWVAQRLVADLRGTMFAHMLKLPTLYYDNNVSSNLISKYTYDVMQVTGAATSVVTISIQDSLTIVGLLAWMLYYNWQLTLIAIVVGPVIAVIVRLFSRRLRSVSRSEQRAMGDLMHVLEESVGCHRVVKIFGGQDYETSRFQRMIETARRFYMKEAVAAEANVPIVQLIASCAVALIVYLAMMQAAAEKTTIGGFVSFITAMVMLLAPLKRLTGVNQTLQRGLAAAESVFEVLDQPSEVDTGTTRIGRAKGAVAFESVRFRYPDAARNALDNVSLKIERGERVALVGASGSGKTTFANLIPRFYTPASGRILLDGIDIADLKLVSLRENLALVSQDVVLFNDTVAANIAYGRLRDTPRDVVTAAAEAAHATEFIRDMQQGFDTLIGENGVRLSGGQRQRLAIARAVIKNAPVLILDEATSALDSESERHVQAALDTLMHGRTTIIIAHRLSTIENADRIVALDQGRIAEVGNHHELMARNGIYAKLYRIQYAMEHENEDTVTS